MNIFENGSMPSLVTLLGHPKRTPVTVPISPSSFSESFSHLATATSHWTPGPDNERLHMSSLCCIRRLKVDLRSVCYAVLRRPAKFGTEPTHLRKYTQITQIKDCDVMRCARIQHDPTENRAVLWRKAVVQSWGSSHSCRHPGSPKCPGMPGNECPREMVGNLVKMEPPLHASYAH